MKELDQSTLDLVKFLDTNKERLHARYRNLVIVVVWLDGDKAELLEWANRHGVSALPLGVILKDDGSLQSWNIAAEASSTTVALRPSTPQANYVNLTEEEELTAFENSLDVHFKTHIKK